jgi:hypothetical protein
VYTSVLTAAQSSHSPEQVPAVDSDALLGTAELAATRAYAHDLETSTVEAVIQGASTSLREYGFCVIDHVIPRAQVAAVSHEISDGMDEKLLVTGYSGAPQRHDILLQPLYSSHVAHPAVLGVAQEALDAHVRIGQWGRRNIPSDDQMPPGERGGFGPPKGRGEHMREYHTDWPVSTELFRFVA